MKKITNVMAVAGLLLTTSTGVAFADSPKQVDNGGEKNTPIDLFLDLATDGGAHVTSPINGNKNVQLKNFNTGNVAQKAWGFNYVPKSTAQTARLAEEGEQDISVLKQSGGESQSINIGVKNRTRNKGTWTLKAKVEGDSLSLQNDGESQKLTGLKVKLTDSEVKEVKILSGNGSLTNVEENAVTAGPTKKDESGKQTIELNGDEITLFTGSPDVVQNGVYDFGFKNASIHLPNVKRIQDGNYNGINIQWKLENAPAAALDAE